MNPEHVATGQVTDIHGNVAALTRQYDYPYLTQGDSAVSQHVVAAYTHGSTQVEALRSLREQLMLRWFDGSAQRKTLAVVSAHRREGRSFITANLAVLFSQLGARTLLIDADVRNPSQHALFGVENGDGLSAVINDRCIDPVLHHNPVLRDLFILPAGPMPPNSPELLAHALFGRYLDKFREQFDIVLLDTPAASAGSGARTVMARAGAALVVVQTNVTRLAQLSRFVEDADAAHATIVGTVVNEFGA